VSDFPHLSSAPRRVRIEQITWQTADVISLRLRGLDGSLPGWQAGAHIDIHLPDGPVRAYSLCGVPDPGPDHYEIAVKREAQSRGGSQAVHDRLRVGMELTIGAPRNLFGLADSAPHHLLLAGGIGLTPLVAMAHALHARGDAFTLAVFARSAEAVALRTVLVNSPWQARVQMHLDDAPSRRTVDSLVAEAPDGSHVYFCGPAGFMQRAREAAAHWPAERVHAEYFAAPPAAPAAAQASPAAGGFEVRLARRRIQLTVAADQSIAQVLMAAGVAVDTVCEQGICGSCVTPYLEGDIDHQDLCLSPQERGSHLALCCSRAGAGGVTLDL